MAIAELILICILVIIVIALMVVNYRVHNKIDTYTNLNQRVTGLQVLQEFMDTIGDDSSVDEKLGKINDVLIQKYSIKYSTIVVYDGAQYKIRASNVDQKHWDTLKNLAIDPVFSDSIKTATPKYITVDNDNEKLPYQKMEFGRAKCAIFFPLYIDNVYIGYWIIEGSIPHEFDKIDTTILDVVRTNIVTILKAIQNQQTIENIVRDDLYSGLKSAEYLYAEGKKKIDQYAESAVCLFKIVNLPEINESVSRKTGDHVITAISNYIKQNLAPDYVFVRYMGPKFAIVFSGIDIDGVTNFMNGKKLELEQLKVPYADDFYKDQPKPEETQTVSPMIRAVISRYYKGTSLDGALKKMEEFIDSSNTPDITSV